MHTRIAYQDEDDDDDDDFMARVLKSGIRSEFFQSVRREGERKRRREQKHWRRWRVRRMRGRSIGFFHGMSPVSHPKWRGVSVRGHSYTSGPDSNGGGRTPRSGGWIKDEIHTARVLFAALFRFFCRSSAGCRPRGSSTFSSVVVALNKMTSRSTQKSSRRDPRVSTRETSPWTTLSGA